MLMEHDGRRPEIHETAWVAPGAILSGEVRVGAGACVLSGAVLTAQGAAVEVGEDCVVMEHAVVRGVPGHPARIGARVLVGPRSHLSGCTVEDEAFLATGVTVFNGARVGAGAEVRINGVVHVRSTVAAGATVPIGWVAVGEACFPPDRHDEIWAIQRELDFPGTVFRRHVEP